MRLGRGFRSVHRQLSVLSILFLTVTSITAILLAWKPIFNTQLYTSNESKALESSIEDWLPLSMLKNRAVEILVKSRYGPDKPFVEKIDIKPTKGYVAFVFNSNYTVVINPKTGGILQVEKRNSNWILALHDGEIVDKIFHTTLFKKAYPTLVGFLLFSMTLTGAFLWYKVSLSRR